jgi:hypothetical protein
MGDMAQEWKRPTRREVQPDNATRLEFGRASKAARTSDRDVSPESVAALMPSPGRPLASPMRAAMEAKFGHDFSQVQVHTDADMAGSALAIQRCSDHPCRAGGCKAEAARLQRATDGDAPAAAPAIAAAALRSAWRPLDPDVQADIGARLGHDLSAVRVHTDAVAAASARQLNARAFTVGRDVVFAAEQFAPSTPAGRALLAHELAHVVQQAAGKGGTGLRVSHPEEPAEIEAREMARSVMAEGAAPLVDAPLLRMLPRSAGNQAVARLLRQDRGPIYRDTGVAASTPSLEQEYRLAVRSANQTGDWRDAAEKLNRFNRADLLSRLSELSDEQAAYLHLGAIGNPRVGPRSQVALLTMPGAPRASTEAPVSAPAPTAQAAVAQAPGRTVAGRLVSDMSATEKLVEAFHRADIGEAVREKILSVINPKALVLAIITFVGLFIASQFTPVGWAADLALALTTVFVGNALLTAAKHLINFAAARHATTTEQLDRAGEEFARAVAEIGVDAVLLLVTHKMASRARGGPPSEGPPSGGVVMVTKGGELALVPAKAIPVEIAAPLAVGAGATVMTMAGRPGGSGGSGTRTRDFEPPVRDHTRKLGGEPKIGGEIPKNGAERKLAIESWSHEELETTVRELEASIAARQAEQAALGETSVSPTGLPRGAQHRVRLDEEIELLRAIRQKLSGS